MHYQTFMDEAQGRIFTFVSVQTFAAKERKYCEVQIDDCRSCKVCMKSMTCNQHKNALRKAQRSNAMSEFCVAKVKRDNMRKECFLYKHLIVTSAYNPTNILRTGSIAFLILKKGMVLLVHSSKADSSAAGRFQGKAVVSGKYLDQRDHWCLDPCVLTSKKAPKSFFCTYKTAESTFISVLYYLGKTEIQEFYQFYEL